LTNTFLKYIIKNNGSIFETLMEDNMKDTLIKINGFFIRFQANAWGQAERGNCKDGIDCAIRSRNEAMELRNLLSKWIKVSTDNQPDVD
jgi:hypothetical protein